MCLGLREGPVPTSLRGPDALDALGDRPITVLATPSGDSVRGQASFRASG